MSADYIRTARAKGVPRRQVILKHAPAQRADPARHRHGARHRRAVRRPRSSPSRSSRSRAWVGCSSTRSPTGDVPVLVAWLDRHRDLHRAVQPVRRRALRRPRSPDPTHMTLPTSRADQHRGPRLGDPVLPDRPSGELELDTRRRARAAVAVAAVPPAVPPPQASRSSSIVVLLILVSRLLRRQLLRPVPTRTSRTCSLGAGRPERHPLARHRRARPRPAQPDRSTPARSR